MKTTLKQIRAQGPCGLHLDDDGERTGYLKLKHHLGKGYGDETPIGIAKILDSNGLDDALWCLRSVKGHQREMRLFAVWCARQVAHLMTGARSTDALSVAERHANGESTDEELAAARDAAWAAARDAAIAAAIAAARDTAWDAAMADAWDAAMADARDAAWDAAWDAARDAQAIELRRVCACIDMGADPYPYTGVRATEGVLV